LEKHTANIRQSLKLVRSNGVGPVIFGRLLTFFGSIDAILGASVSSLAKVEGVGEKTAEKIFRSRNDFDAEKELAIADKFGVCVLDITDDRYPAALKKIYDPPPVLYVKGDIRPSDGLAVAIVGSRQCSNYGTEQASRFGHLLAASGFTIISGMARGIDSEAHKGALSAGGRTIAVQGCGLSRIFPPENKNLFEKICQNGACVSELPMEYEPLPENFPPRNRIIAGLSVATIVVEAMPRSGALITAQTALENNREVMAIPGKIDSPLSKGPHKLIKQGAKLIESVDDVIEALEFLQKDFAQHVEDSSRKAIEKTQQNLFDMSKLNLTKEEQKIMDCLDSEPIHVEELIAKSELPAGKVNASLISMRLKGIIKQFPGNYFSKR
jgi:DNA processing protein